MTESSSAAPGGRSGQAAAERVRAFYESHPYPPPVEDLDGYRERWSDEGRRRAWHHLSWPGVPFGTPRSLLVAGCGTAQAARHALRDPARRVVGIDVSETGLDATRALKVRYGLDNLEVHRLPLEEAGELEERFDEIVCTGVLHHLPDPNQGLAALREVLAPGGALHLMVYAPYGRAGVYLIQEYARLLGVGTTPAEIQELVETIREIPPHHPLRPLLERAPDFRSREGLADALLNPQDRAYSVPQLLELVQGAGLQLGRWLRQAAYLPRCGAPLLTPHRDRLKRLPPEEQWAAMELFRGTMVRHSAVLRCGSEPLPGPESEDALAEGVAAEAGEWRSWVPVPRPDTVRVTEGIPETATAVLINRAHEFTDLYLPIDAVQAGWFDSADGRRSLGEILGPGEDVTEGRAFFRRLWDYDQVVFDAS